MVHLSVCHVQLKQSSSICSGLDVVIKCSMASRKLVGKTGSIMNQDQEGTK